MASNQARLAELVQTSRSVAAERGRKGKVGRIAAYLGSLSPSEAAIAATYLAGELPQGRIGIGPALLARASRVPLGPRVETTIAELHADLTDIAALSGPGSQDRRRRSVEALFYAMTPEERDFAIRLLLGELRHGAVAGLTIEAIAAAVEVPVASVRRAAMLTGDIARVAQIAFDQGRVGLAQVSLTLFSPVAPMLAQPADDLDDAMTQLADAYLELKLDGARVQVHKKGNEVRVFSRQGNDVTASVPELVEIASAVAAEDLVLDGETLVLRENGRPQPFQTTMRRFGRRRDVEALGRELPLMAFFFDCIYLDGQLLIDAPATVRYEALADALAGERLIERRRCTSKREAMDFLNQALALGHEGLMVKDPASTYQAGGRGGHWLKVKQVFTLDLVVLAAEWGSGRRRRWLSNLHLGARDPDGGFVMLGKTFKGLSDTVLAWQTEQLLAREIAREGQILHVRPELVVEIAFNELQESPHYPAGLALRFARVKRYRPDKSAVQADTIDTVRGLFAQQISYQSSEVSRTSAR
jgi:DNA ligase-1